MNRFCPYCHCLILDDGHCRNTKCVLGDRKKASYDQRNLISSLMEELDKEVSEKKLNKLTKEKASKLIKRLLEKKADLEAEQEDYEE